MKMRNAIGFALPMFLGAGLALAVGACADRATPPQANDRTATAPPAAMPADHAMPAQSSGSMELHRIMSEGQKAPMAMSGDVDKDFATMMSMHHKMAIDMADAPLGLHRHYRSKLQKRTRRPPRRQRTFAARRHHG